MTPFEHLSVLISIVIGMGIAQLLCNARYHAIVSLAVAALFLSFIVSSALLRRP